MSERDAPLLPGKNIVKPVTGAGTNPWRENLPDGCPPSDAVPLAPQVIQRLSTAEQATDDDFKSHACLGRVRPRGSDECSFCSCSFFLASVDIGVLVKLPSMKKMNFILSLRVDHNSGLAKTKDHSGHVDLWMYASFAPLSAIQAIRAL